jgi:ADP-ribose pyrophosphatase YjhB (NUDIX family)
MIGESELRESLTLAVAKRAAFERTYTETTYATSVHLPIALRRLGYRTAYRGLQLFWFVARPSKSGVKCVLTDGDRILLVRHTYGHRDWDLPGGALKRNEQPLSGARREMGEELAIGSAEWTALGELRGTVDRRRDTVHCFQAKLAAPTITIDRGELATAKWFPRTQLPPDLGPYVVPIVSRLQVGRADH